MVVEITATGQQRRKVLYEISESGSNRTIFIIQLDERDFLATIIYDQNNRQHTTSLVSPNRFAAFYINRPRPTKLERAVLITVRISPLDNNPNNWRGLKVELFIDNKLASFVEAEGTFAKKFQGHTSLGSARGEIDPITCSVGEVISFRKALDDETLFKLNRYTKTKWDVGEEVERVDRILSQVKKDTTMLLVEDKYDQLYKLAWLKIHNINVEAERVEQIFSDKSHFTIIGCHGANAVAGVLRTRNSHLYSNHRIVGLFDFDTEGVENFHHLKKERENWSKEVLGDKSKGFYKKRLNHPCLFGMLLPIPAELGHLADLRHSGFANYVEIENLLPKEFLQQNTFVTEELLPGTSYLKVKKNCKHSLWRKATKLTSKNFENFRPIFETFDKLVSGK